jgi:hypothetical protein
MSSKSRKLVSHGREAGQVELRPVLDHLDRTVIGWPGSNLPTRVERVTPSTSWSSPALPRTTSGGGIPAMLLPCWAICFASFAGPAPLTRPGGRRSVRGSAWTNSRRGPAGVKIADSPAKSCCASTSPHVTGTKPVGSLPQIVEYGQAAAKAAEAADPRKSFRPSARGEHVGSPG